MYTRLTHGSQPNRSSAPRDLYICVYSAADALPIPQSPCEPQSSYIDIHSKPGERIASRSEPLSTYGVPMYTIAEAYTSYIYYGASNARYLLHS